MSCSEKGMPTRIWRKEETISTRGLCANAASTSALYLNLDHTVPKDENCNDKINLEKDYQISKLAQLKKK